MARRNRRSRRFGRGRKTKAAWLDLAADANIALQAAEPMLPAAAAAMKGDVAAALAAGKAGLKEVVSPTNLVQAAGPKLALGLTRKVMGFLGVKPKTKFGGRRLI